MEKSLTNFIKLKFRNIFIEVYLNYNIVLDLGVHQNESVVYMYISTYVCVYIYIYIYIYNFTVLSLAAHIYTIFQIIFHYKLLQDFEYCSLRYIVNSSCLSISYIVVCIC